MTRVFQIIKGDGEVYRGGGKYGRGMCLCLCCVYFLLCFEVRRGVLG